MYEHRREPLLARPAFLARVLRHLMIAASVIMGSLGIGILGYHHFEKLSWLDSLLNASMILSSMGPVSPLQTDAGKVFASGYALFSGVVFVTTIGVIFAPVAHRVLHKFHLETESSGSAKQRPGPPGQSKRSR